MLSFQIKEEISKILVGFKDAQYFFDCLKNINATFPELDKYIQQIAQGSDLNGSANGLRAHLTQVRQKIGEVKPRSFFSSMEKLQFEINQAKEYGFNDISQLIKIDIQIDEFSHSYETYIETYSPESAATMIVEGKSLESLLYGFKHGLTFYLNNIELPISEIENRQELSIVLSTQLTLSEFISKLQTIEKIYFEMCMLTNVSTEEFPIQISKIESGSLWAKLFGESKVISLMTSFIESTASYAYRNYTNEGKIAAIPMKISAIDSVLEIRTKLEAQGIEVDGMNDHLSKSAVIIAKELNKLIEGQPEIVVNDKKLTVGHEIQQKFLNSNTTQRLEFENQPE